jgi:hypothetical protein
MIVLVPGKSLSAEASRTEPIPIKFDWPEIHPKRRKLQNG